jgi:hypothetical protein
MSERGEASIKFREAIDMETEPDQDLVSLRSPSVWKVRDYHDPRN